MFLVLTALAILPGDLAEKEASIWRLKKEFRISFLERETRSLQKDIESRDAKIRALPADNPLRRSHYNTTTWKQEELEQYRMQLHRAELAELRGPPFASSIWRVRTVHKK